MTDAVVDDSPLAPAPDQDEINERMVQQAERYMHSFESWPGNQLKPGPSDQAVEKTSDD
jgi:hypothetical protein